MALETLILLGLAKVAGVVALVKATRRKKQIQNVEPKKKKAENPLAERTEFNEMPIADIAIPFNPNLVGGTSFSLSWHGLMSFFAVAAAIWMVGRAAIKGNLNQDMVYNTAIFGIVGGIIGARLVHVFDKRERGAPAGAAAGGTGG